MDYSTKNHCSFIGHLATATQQILNTDGDWFSLKVEGLPDLIRIEVVGRLAEICERYLKVGSKVYIIGEFRGANTVFAKELIMLAGEKKELL